MVKTPVDFTSLVPISARAAMILPAADFLSSQPVAMASARAPLVMALAVLPLATAFFIGAMAARKC